MADNTNKEKVVISFETNADDTTKDISKLSASIEQTTESTTKANKATKELNEAKKESTKASKEQAGAMDSLNNATGGTIEQVKGLAQSFKALLANPVVLVLTAIVGALALLYKAFTSTNDGADKMEQAMAGISATIDVLRDRVLKVGGAIAKFFSGDFKGALQDARTAVSGIGDEIASEFKKASEATAYLQEVEDAMRDLGVARAKVNRDLVQARELLQDENASYAEKKRALKEVGQAEQAQTALELENAKKKLQALKERNALSDKSDEKLQEEANAQSAIFQLQEESARNQIKLNKQSAALDREENARRKTARDEAEKAEKERREKEIEESKKRAQDEIDAIQSAKDFKEQILNENDKLDADAIAKAESDFAFRKALKDKELSDEAIALEAKKANQQQIVSQGENLIRNVAQLAGKNKAIQKAAIIADGGVSLGKAVSNTAEAVTKDLAKGAPFSAPLVALDLAVGATSVASIIQGTSKALQAVGGGGSISAPSIPSAPTGVNAQPQTGFQASSENQIATSISQSQQALPPIKAFVVGSDVTTQQSLDANLVKENSFGG